MNNKIVWVGGYPSHYMRAMHCSLESKFPGRFEFLYTEQVSERKYERGSIPQQAFILRRQSLWNVWTLLTKRNPAGLIVAGHFPRAVFYATLWAFVLRRKVFYWADTNLLDEVLRNGLSKFFRRAILKQYLTLMHSLVYPGVRTRDYYYWICGTKAKTKLVWLPYTTIESREPQKEWFPDTINILFVGRLVPEKGVEELVRALGLLSDQNRARVCLWIGGDGPERKFLEHLVHDLSLDNLVRFHGAVPSDHAIELFNAASIFVLPSCREPWGVVVCEAMTAGLPIIAPFWVGAVADLVQNGYTGIVLNDNSPKEIARGIEYFIQHPTEIHRMGRAAQEVIRNGCFRIDCVQEIISGILDKLKHGVGPSLN